MKFFIFIILLNLLVNTSVLKADELSKSAENHLIITDMMIKLIIILNHYFLLVIQIKIKK